MSLQGKHALITGSSREIGRGIALKLAEQGPTQAHELAGVPDSSAGDRGRGGGLHAPGGGCSAGMENFHTGAQRRRSSHGNVRRRDSHNRGSRVQSCAHDPRSAEPSSCLGASCVGLIPAQQKPDVPRHGDPAAGVGDLSFTSTGAAGRARLRRVHPSISDYSRGESSPCALPWSFRRLRPTGAPLDMRTADATEALSRDVRSHLFTEAAATARVPQPVRQQDRAGVAQAHAGGDRGVARLHRTHRSVLERAMTTGVRCRL